MDSGIIREKQDMTYLMWSRTRNSSGTAGSFLKAYSKLGGNKIYYKLSDYDNLKGVVGHESVNELIADRLLDILGIDHLHYQLIHADVCIDDKIIETYICASENFRKKNEDKTPLDVFFENNRSNGESPLDFCERMGWGDYVNKMFAVDFLILNRDRHGANIEVLRNKDTKSLRLAPLFDHGLSLLCRCLTDEAAEKFDVTEDRQIQSFLASRSAFENLKLIPPDKMPRIDHLKESSRDILMDGLDGIISHKLQDRIWEMIWKRRCIYEDFCNQR